MAWGPIIQPFTAVFSICSIRRKPTEAGTGAGASITCTARFLPYEDCKRRESAIARSRATRARMDSRLSECRRRVG